MVRDATHTLTSLTSCNYEPGYTMPLLECASGHADLAHMPDQARLDMRAGIEAFERRSPMHGMFESDRPVQRMRDDGYVTCHRNPHTPFPGKTSSIAVPIFECGRVVGTLTLAFFASAMSIDDAVARYRADMQATACCLSDELGSGTQSFIASDMPPAIVAAKACAARAAGRRDEVHVSSRAGGGTPAGRRRSSALAGEQRAERCGDGEQVPVREARPGQRQPDRHTVRSLQPGHVDRGHMQQRPHGIERHRAGRGQAFGCHADSARCQYRPSSRRFACPAPTARGNRRPQPPSRSTIRPGCARGRADCASALAGRWRRTRPSRSCRRSAPPPHAASPRTRHRAADESRGRPRRCIASACRA